MELNFTNQKNKSIIVFASKVLYTPDQILDLVQPMEILKKAGYDYYWKKNSQENINSYFSNYVRSRTGSTLEFLGRCPGQGDSVHMVNVQEVPDWFYIFYIDYTGDGDTCSYYSTVPIKSIFAYNDTYVISVYNIQYSIGPYDMSQQNDEVNQVLTVQYRAPSNKLSTFQLDWKPKLGNQGKEPIIFTILVLIMIIIVIIVLSASFYIIYQIEKKVVHHTDKYTTNHIPEEKPQQLFLD